MDMEGELEMEMENHNDWERGRPELAELQLSKGQLSANSQREREICKRDAEMVSAIYRQRLREIAPLRRQNRLQTG